MMDAGMNILLINLSMTPRDICKEVIGYVREIEKESNYNRLLAVAMDMTAAPMRTGIFEGVSSAFLNFYSLRDLLMRPILRKEVE